MPNLLHGLHFQSRADDKSPDSAALNDETHPHPHNPDTGDHNARLSDEAYKGEDGKDPGLEKNAHMTNDAAPGSHSELFGLSPKDGPDKNKNAGAGLGTGIQGGTGSKGSLNLGSNEPGGTGLTGPGGTTQSTTGPMDQGGDKHEPPGAGGMLATPSQGSGKIPAKTDKGGYVP